MSHITKINLEVRDLECLRLAAEQLGGTLNTDARTYKTYGGLKANCTSGAISFKQTAFQIGLQQVATGYRMDCDLWTHTDGGLPQVCGTDLGLLKQAYAEQLARKTYARQGYSMRKETQEDGSVLLYATR